MTKHVIAKYGPFIFRCFSFYIKEKQNWYIQYDDFFIENNNNFLKIYKRRYPNHSLQIFKDNKKVLVRDIRVLIESYIDDPYFYSLNRDFNLMRLLD